MNIKTINRDLYVLQVVERNSNYESMLCTDMLEEKENRYNVLKITNYSILYQIMPMFNQQLKNIKFSDYIECFSKDNVFYVMFKHTDDNLLIEQLSTKEYSLNERLIITKNLIERIVTQNMPYSIQTDILQSKNITLSNSLDIKFRYYLNNMYNYPKIDFKSLQKSLLNIIGIILNQEINNNVSEKLSKYCENLKKGNYSEPIELYAEYIHIYDGLLNNPNITKSLIKHNKLLKIWEKIRNLLKWLKPFVICLLIVIALIYLLYTALGYNKKDTSQYNTYKIIGTLNIKEYSEK